MKSIFLLSITVLVIGCGNMNAHKNYREASIKNHFQEGSVSMAGAIFNEDKKMLDTRKIIDSYQLFEKDGDLFFILTLKNNTSEDIKINPTTTPFSIDYNFERIESSYLIPSPRPVPEMIVIAPSESHDLEFNISDEYDFREGRNTYDFVFAYGKDYTYDELVRIGYKNVIKQDTIFSFTWDKKPSSRKGELVSIDFNKR